MNIHLQSLKLVCRKDVPPIEFLDFTFFYGEIGAGKSTIARMIDFCFGGHLVLTPALQHEFMAAVLTLKIGEVPIRISRDRESDRVTADWKVANETRTVILPARKAAGVVVPNSQIEVLSDLLFSIAGLNPPRVRKSATREDSDICRLSFRDLWWYCYLDQDEIDSEFFHLERNADFPKQLKSRQVLRYVLGIHQEGVSEIEEALERSRLDRMRYEEAAKILTQTLEDASLPDEATIESRLVKLVESRDRAVKQILAIRAELPGKRNHVTERLQEKARAISDEIRSFSSTIDELTQSMEKDQRHLNEIRMLRTKVKRMVSARALLRGVQYESCPRCDRTLPVRPEEQCSLCGQPDIDDTTSEQEADIAEADIDSREKELLEVIGAQKHNLTVIERNLARAHSGKQAIDGDLDRALVEYDSAFLSSVLNQEREIARIDEEIKSLRQLKVLPVRVGELSKAAENARILETKYRTELRALREKAESDTKNLNRLGALFLDCLVRARIPGFSLEDTVLLKPPFFFPEVINPASGELATVSFSTLGSGGKKTLFKACFAVALHRLAAEIGAVLPTLLIIDSPMKNISERENRTQFEGFHELLYDLAMTELSNTQFILIDKEFCAPSSAFKRGMSVRHMTVEDTNNPPLIQYYRDRGASDGPKNSGME